MRLERERITTILVFISRVPFPRLESCGGWFLGYLMDDTVLIIKPTYHGNLENTNVQRKKNYNYSLIEKPGLSTITSLMDFLSCIL